MTDTRRHASPPSGPSDHVAEQAATIDAEGAWQRREDAFWRVVGLIAGVALAGTIAVIAWRDGHADLGGEVRLASNAAKIAVRALGAGACR